MAAVSLKRIGTGLPAMQKDRGRRSVRQYAAVWTRVIGAGWSAGKRNNAILEFLTLVAEPVAFYGMTSINESR